VLTSSLTCCTKVRKMKAIYYTLNQFSSSSASSAGLDKLSSSQKSLIGECWCPVKHLDVIHRALRRGTVGDCLSFSVIKLMSNDPSFLSARNLFKKLVTSCIHSYPSFLYEKHGHTRYQALGLELNLVYRQSARR